MWCFKFGIKLGSLSFKFKCGLLAVKLKGVPLFALPFTRMCRPNGHK